METLHYVNHLSFLVARTSTRTQAHMHVLLQTNRHIYIYIYIYIYIPFEFCSFIQHKIRNIETNEHLINWFRLLCFWSALQRLALRLFQDTGCLETPLVVFLSCYSNSWEVHWNRELTFPFIFLLMYHSSIILLYRWTLRFLFVDSHS
jgi:hypothetical protein